MTVMKEKAVEMIQRIPEDNMASKNALAENRQLIADQYAKIARLKRMLAEADGKH